MDLFLIQHFYYLKGNSGHPIFETDAPHLPTKQCLSHLLTGTFKRP